MAPAVVVPSLAVQNDWHTVVTDVSNGAPAESFWMALYVDGQDTRHESVLVKKRMASEGIFLDGGESIDATPVSPTRFTCRFGDDGKEWTVEAPAVQTNAGIGSVGSVHLSPAGELAVVGATNGRIVVLDTHDLSLRRVLEGGHVGDITAVNFFPSGQVVLSAATDCMVKIWSVLDGSCPRTFKGHTAPVTGLAIVSRGKNVISTSKDGTARLWDCGSGDCIKTLLDTSADEEAKAITCVALFAAQPPNQQSRAAADPREAGTQGCVAAFGCASGRIYVVDVAAAHIVQTMECGAPVNCIAAVQVAGRAAPILVSGHDDGHIMLWAVDQPTPIMCVQLRVKASVVQVSAVNRPGTLSFAVSTSDGQVAVVECDLGSASASVRLVLSGWDLDPVNGLHLGGEQVLAGGRDGRVCVYRGIV
ncbi:hypothetical protein RI367_001696 [Sorochytrium milnesiophthora]